MTLHPHETAGLALGGISLIGQSLSACVLALGGISLFGQTLSACVHGSERYNKAKDLVSEFADIETNRSWARRRLATWAEDWGIEEGCLLVDDGFQKHVEMATSHLVYINYLFARLDKAKKCSLLWKQPANMPSCPACRRGQAREVVQDWRRLIRGAPGPDGRDPEAERQSEHAVKGPVLSGRRPGGRDGGRGGGRGRGPRPPGPAPERRQIRRAGPQPRPAVQQPRSLRRGRPECRVGSDVGGPDAAQGPTHPPRGLCRVVV